MFKVEEERDKKSEESVQSKFKYDARISTEENKDLIYDKILNPKESFFNLKSLI